MTAPVIGGTGRTRLASAALAVAIATASVVACGGRSDAPNRQGVGASTDAIAADGGDGDGGDEALPPGVAYTSGGAYCCEKGIGRTCCPPNERCSQYGGGIGECLPAGSPISGKDVCTVCCDGMNVIFRMTVVDGKCVSDDTHPEEEWLCAACGDGLCHASAGENPCNCPADCGPPP